MTDTPPGERQPRETAVAYEAFRTYVEMGTARSTAKVAQALCKSKTLMDRWSGKNRWVERVREIDSAEGAAVDEVRTDALRDAATRQAQEARLHASATVLVGQALVRKVAADPSILEGLPIEDLVRLEATMARAHNRIIVTERLALGMTTEQSGEKIPRAAAMEMVAKLTDDELDARLTGVDELAEKREQKKNRAA